MDEVGGRSSLESIFLVHKNVNFVLITFVRSVPHLLIVASYFLFYTYFIFKTLHTYLCFHIPNKYILYNIIPNCLLLFV